MAPRRGCGRALREVAIDRRLLRDLRHARPALGVRGVAQLHHGLDLQGDAPRRLPPPGLGRGSQPDRGRAQPPRPDDPRVRQLERDPGARHAGTRPGREPRERRRHGRLSVERHLGLLPGRAEGRRPAHAPPAGPPAQPAPRLTRCASSRTSSAASAGASPTSSRRGGTSPSRAGGASAASTSSTRWRFFATAGAASASRSSPREIRRARTAARRSKASISASSRTSRSEASHEVFRILLRDLPG